MMIGSTYVATVTRTNQLESAKSFSRLVTENRRNQFNLV